MLGLVDTCALFLFADAEADGLVQQQTDEQGHDQLKNSTKGTHCLPPQLVDAAAVEQTVDAGRCGLGCQEADREGAPETTEQVDADHVERVVIAELVLQSDGQRTDHASENTDDDRAHGRDRGAGRSDGDQSGDDAGRGAKRGGMAVADALGDQPAQACGTSGDHGVHPDHRRGVARGDGGTGIEAEPAEPQQTGAEHDQGQVVRPHRIALPAEPLARMMASARPAIPALM